MAQLGTRGSPGHRGSADRPQADRKPLLRLLLHPIGRVGAALVTLACLVAAGVVPPARAGVATLGRATSPASTQAPLVLHAVPGGLGRGPAITDPHTGHTFVDADGTVSMIDTPTGIVIRSVPVGLGYGTLAVDQSRPRLLVLSSGRGPIRVVAPTLATIDTRSDTLLRSVTLPGGAGGQLFLDGRAGCALAWSELGTPGPHYRIAITTVAISTGARVRTLTLAVAGPPVSGLVDDVHGRLVLVTSPLNTLSQPRPEATVVVLDTHTGALVGTSMVPAGVLAVGGDPIHGRMAILSALPGATQGTLTVADTTTGAIIASRSLTLPAETLPMVVMDAADARVVIPTADGLALLSAVDGTALSVLRVGRATPLLDVTRRRIVAVGHARAWVYALPDGTLLHSSTLPAAPGDSYPPLASPTNTGGDMVLDPVNGRVYLLTHEPAQALHLVILDDETGMILRRVDLQPHVGWAAIVQDAPGNRIAVLMVSPDWRTHTFTALDATSGAILGRDQVGCSAALGPYATGFLTVDSVVHRLYCVDPGPLNHDMTALVGVPGTLTVWDLLRGRRLGRFALQPYPRAAQVVSTGPATGYALIPEIGTAGIVGPPHTTPADGVRVAPRGAPTHHTLTGRFLAFWRRYGGVDTFGYPETEPYVESGHLVQYMDRFVLEDVHGSIRTMPVNDVLVDQRQFGRLTGAPGRGTVFFARTGHTLAGRFLSYWRTHNGARLLGMPISEPFREGNDDGSGRRYLVQWFEKGRLEYHPELAGTRYEVELGLVGLQALRQRGW